jgi:hypothetical protein
MKYNLIIITLFATLFSCTKDEKVETETTDLVTVPLSGVYSKIEEVKTLRYAHELGDTLTVTNEGITNATVIPTIALRMETSNGCAIQYYYFDDEKCILHAAKGKLYYMAKKLSDCSIEPIIKFDTPIIIHNSIANVGDSWTTYYNNPVATVREYVGKDTITTPAGTFNCEKYKLTVGTTGGAPIYQWFSTIGLIKEEHTTQVAQPDPLLPEKFGYTLIYWD